MLIPVPINFKLEVHVYDSLIGAIKPMKTEYAQGHYVSTLV